MMTTTGSPPLKAFTRALAENSHLEEAPNNTKLQITGLNFYYGAFRALADISHLGSSRACSPPTEDERSGVGERCAREVPTSRPPACVAAGQRATHGPRPTLASREHPTCPSR